MPTLISSLKVCSEGMTSSFDKRAFSMILFATSTFLESDSTIYASLVLKFAMRRLPMFSSASMAEFHWRSTPARPASLTSRAVN